MSASEKHTPSSDFNAQIDAACDALESAWRQGESPNWRDFVVGTCTDEQQSCCVDLIAVDMEWRHKAQLPVRAEDYLAHVSGEPSPAVQASIIRHEFELRLRRGDKSGPEEYFQRFPELSDVLSTMFPKEASTSKPASSSSRPGKRMKPTADEFSERLTESGILSAEQVDNLRKATGLTAAAASAETLAKQLVKAGKLTKFQAQLAYNDKTKKLVMGSYVILEKLGEGGMGQVYKARHKRMKREVALKVLAPQFVKDEAALQRFHREVEAAARLNHPNIVTAHDADEARGTHYLVMELVSGDDLSQLVSKSGPLSVTKAVDCVLQAARGLAYAHGQNVVHRDIKPSNLLLDKDGTVKILDMGLARFDETGNDDVAAAALTGTGMLMGTVDYMAPEQALDSKTADHRADIYSLGCTLYFLLTGQPMYGEDTVMKRIMAHQNAAIPKLPVEDDELQMLFEQMVAKKVEDRIEPAQIVVAALEAWMAREAAAAEATPEPLDETFIQPAADTSPTASEFQATVVPEKSPANIQPLESSEPAADPSVGPDSAVHIDNDSAVPLPSKPRPPRNGRAKPNAKPSAAGSGGLFSNRKLLLAGSGGIAALLLLATIIFKFSTRDGTVIVELDGDVEIATVEIDERRVEFSPDGSDKRLKFSVPSGSHELTITTADGLELTTELGEKPLEIKAGGNATLKAWVENVSDRVELSKLEWSLPEDAPAPAVAPFDTAQARRYQKEWAEYLGVSTGTARKLPGGAVIDFVLIPPGEFMMGSSDVERERLLEIARIQDVWHAPDRIPYEGPQHPVRITKPFYMSKCEITQEQWESVMGTNPAVHKNNPLNPVENVSWNDVQEFTSKLKFDGGLPTEAQWEYATRAGTTTAKYFSDSVNIADTEMLDHVWSNQNSTEKTHPVGALQPNPFGLHDVYGNVWEWVADLRGRYNATAIPTEDPLEALNGNARVRRGGCYFDGGLIGRSACRYSLPSRMRKGDTGFRLAATIKFPAEAKSWKGLLGDAAKVKPEDAAYKPTASTPYPRPKYNPAPLPKIGTWEPNGTADINKQFPDRAISDSASLPGLALRPAKLSGVKRWNVTTSTPRGGPYVADFSPDGKLLAIGSSDGHVRIYDAATLELRHLLPGIEFQHGVQCLDWHPDGKSVVVGTQVGRMAIWDLSSVPRLTENEKFAGLRSVQFSPDGEKLVVDSNGYRLKVVDLSTNKVTHVSLAGNELVYNAGNVVWSPDGTMLASLHEDKSLRIWTADGKLVQKVDGFAGFVYPGHGIQWSPSGEWIGVIDSGKPKQIQIVSPDGKRGKPVELNSVSDLRVFGWTNDGSKLYALSHNGISDVDFATRGVQTMGLKNLGVLAVNPADGSIVCIADANSKYYVLSVFDRELQQIASRKCGKRTWKAVWSPDENGFIAATVYEFLYFDSTGKMISELGTSYGNNPVVAWHPSAKKAVMGSHLLEGVYVGEVAGKMKFKDSVKCSSLSWSHDGRYWVAGMNGESEFHVYDDRGTRIKRVACPAASPVVSFHPNIDLLLVECGQEVFITSAANNWQLEPAIELENDTLTVEWNSAGDKVFFRYNGIYSFDGSEFKKLDLPTPDHCGWNGNDTLRASCMNSRLLIHDGKDDSRLASLESIVGSFVTTSMHPSRDLFLTTHSDHSIIAWDLQEADAYWRTVFLEDGQSITISAAGQIMHGDRKLVDEQLVYYVENKDGTIETLTPTEFEKRIGESIYVPEPPSPLVGETPKAVEQEASQPRAALGSDERKELFNLLRSVIRVDTGRMAQVNATDDFLKTPSAEKWSDVREQATNNRTKLRTVIAQIEELNSEFVVDEMETYRQLMIDLDAKALGLQIKSTSELCRSQG